MRITKACILRFTNVHFCGTHEHRKGNKLGTVSEMFLQEKCIELPGYTLFLSQQ